MSQAGISADGMKPPKLILAEGWTRTRPRKLAYGLVYLSQGRLWAREADLGAPRPLDAERGEGPRREARAPVCVDGRAGLVYWIKRELPPGRPDDDRAELTATTLARPHESRRLAPAEGFGELLALDEREGELLSFLGGSGEPRLAFVDTESGAVRVVAVEGGEAGPADVCFARRRILFGREGADVTVHDLDGRIVAAVRAPADPECLRFHPSLDSAVIAHGGLSIWDIAAGTLRRVADEGRNAAWSPDGRALWFTELDSELWVLDLSTSRRTRVLKLEGDSAGCTNFTNRLRWSPDGRHLLAQLSRKAAVTAAEEARRREAEPEGWDTGQRFDFDHYFCVLEPAAGRLWLRRDYSHQVAWAKLP